MAKAAPLAIIYFNGHWIEANDTLLQALKPGRLRGEGVFETVAVENGRLCFWPEHYARFERGLRAYGLTCRFGCRALERLAGELLLRNRLSRARLRIARYRDLKQNYTVLAAAPVATAPAAGRPLRVHVSALCRRKDRYSHLKSVTYQPFYHAHQEAVARGCHEALLLDPHGRLVEGSTTNIFFVRGDTLHTPATAVGCLNGIVRRQVIRLAPQNGLRVQCGAYTLSELWKADEVFMTNSLIGVRAVASVDGRPCAAYRPHADRLRKAYRQLIITQTTG